MSQPSTLRLAWDETPSAACRGGALTVGNFDGVHLGHASLIQILREEARNIGGPAVVLSFDPHPLMLLAPERFQPVLTTADERAALLKRCGADEVVLLRTTAELLQLSPAEFFARILQDGFSAKAIVEGFNFQFGRDRAGTNETLAQLCRGAGIGLTVVPPLEQDGAPVSSSRVRDALLAGDVPRAARLLSRAYRLRGVVGEGARRGRTLGFPTANLQNVETLIPGDGVYAVRSEVDGVSWPGAANVGPNPTFGEQARKLEVHLLDFHGDLYGHTVNVEFLAKLRDTKTFAGAVELKQQLHEDIERVRQLLK